MITKDVPAGSLAVERAEQRTVKGYRKRKDAEHRGRLKGATVEIITKKRMMLFSGTIHPALGHEIADNLGIPVSESKLRRFASGEIYFRSEESVRGADVFVVQTHYEPVNEAIMEQLIMIDAMKRASAKRITAVDPVLRLLAAGPQGAVARADQREARRRPDRDGRRRPRRLDRPALAARSRGTSTSRSTT